MIEKIKNHWQEHKEKYYIGAIAALTITTTALYFKNQKEPLEIGTKVLNKQGIAINSPITTKIQIAKMGNSGNVIQCNETGTTYMSQNQAAKDLGISASAISDHLNGKNPHANGYTFNKVFDGKED